MGNARPPFELFASTALGLESIAAGELKSLGIRGKQEIGGVGFSGDLDRLYRANLWLRTASRVLVRLGSFHASTFYELERRARKIPWPEFLPAAGTVTVRATCRKSRLYHSDAVAQRVLEAISRSAPVEARLQTSVDGAGEESDEEADDTAATQLFVVRIVHDQVEISADSSGDLLHRRGYRQEIAKAPLRETLAAAMVLASGWRRNEQLLDPLCGSGTIPIEAALIARNIAPGISRDFQFMKWPSFDARRWSAIGGEARDAAKGGGLEIRGTDRDSGAIGAAGRNAERAGVADDIDFAVSSLTESLAALDGGRDAGVASGWILANPPYGVRVGGASDLRDLYAVLGRRVGDNPGWRLGVLSADQALAGQLRLPVRSRFSSRNGGIPVTFLVSEKVAEAATFSSKPGVAKKMGER
jgi:putative N6-adenine-specific DNA methylase